MGPSNQPASPGSLSVVAARRVLLATAPGRAAAALARDPDLDAALAGALERVAEAWPWYDAAPSLLALAGAGLEVDEASAATLAARKWEDLALLDGFRRALPEAAEIVDGVLASHAAEAALARGAPPDQADDLVQEQLSRLLEPLGAVKYRGRGHLAAWLRRCVVNAWIDAKRRKHAISLESIDLDQHAVVVLEAEADSVARRFRPHFKVALAAAFDAMPDRDRTLLRMIHLDGLTAKQVGAALGMHRGSVQRRLGDVRRALRARVLDEIERRFGIGGTAASSMLRAFSGRLDETLSRLIEGREAPS